MIYEFDLSLGGMTMDSGKVTDREGCWYLRQIGDDSVAIRLVSERAPVGTIAIDLKPATIEVDFDGESETVQFELEQLRAFIEWPPKDGL